MTTALAEQIHVALWAQTRDGDGVHYDGVTTSAVIEEDGREVMIHAFAPGDDNGAVVTLAFSHAEATRMGLGLIRASNP